MTYTCTACKWHQHCCLQKPLRAVWPGPFLSYYGDNVLLAVKWADITARNRGGNTCHLTNPRQQSKSQKCHLIFCLYLRKPHERGKKASWGCMHLSTDSHPGGCPPLQEIRIAHFLWQQNFSKQYLSIQACFTGKGHWLVCPLIPISRHLCP